MLTQRKLALALYVDRSTGQWVVRDLDGDFWIVPITDTPWAERQPYHPAEGTELDPVPGHYKTMLGLPY
jgi:hypothetical protein